MAMDESIVNMGRVVKSGRLRGFTIVELLIVIVVIAILAAVSIAAYTNMQQRARDSKRVSDIEAIVRGLSVWGADTGGDFVSMSAGAAGMETGWFDGTYDSYPSVRSVLVAGGYISSGVRDPINIQGQPGYAYMISTCTSGDLSVRIILARLERPPEKTVNEQLGMSCGGGNFASYTGSYGMNYGRAVRL